MNKFKKSSNSIIGYSSSKLAKSEKNDCFVRAIATATDTSYESAHKYVKNQFGRKKGKGVLFTSHTLESIEKDGMEIDNKTFDFRVLSKGRITNTYKLYGEFIRRQKTVKSFIKDNPKGTYIVGVSKHAFTIKDGVLFDNDGEEFRPTRKVTSVFQLKNTNQKQFN